MPSHQAVSIEGRCRGGVALTLASSQGLQRCSSLWCCHSVLSSERTAEGSSPLAAADGCSREEACSACMAAARISVGSDALLAPSTDARKASRAAMRALLLCASAPLLWPCQHGVRAETAAPTPLRALALTCGNRCGRSSQGSPFCTAAKAHLAAASGCRDTPSPKSACSALYPLGNLAGFQACLGDYSHISGRVVRAWGLPLGAEHPGAAAAAPECPEGLCSACFAPTPVLQSLLAPLGCQESQQVRLFGLMTKLCCPIQQ